MLRKLITLAAVGCCLFVTLQALLLWDATGRDGFTKHFDPEVAQAEANSGGLSDLFDDTGFDEGEDDIDEDALENRFRLGLMPSAESPADKYFVSVASIAGPALAAAACILILGCTGRKKTCCNSKPEAKPNN